MGVLWEWPGCVPGSAVAAAGVEQLTGGDGPGRSTPGQAC